MSHWAYGYAHKRNENRRELRITGGVEAGKIDALLTLAVESLFRRRIRVPMDAAPSKCVSRLKWFERYRASCGVNNTGGSVEIVHSPPWGGGVLRRKIRIRRGRGKSRDRVEGVN